MPASSRSDIAATVNRGLAWVGMASSAVWLLDILGIFIVLGLWIPPEQMGIAALAIPFFPALDLASEMGLGAAVVQRDDHTEDRISTIFWLNLFGSVVLAAVLALGIGPGIGALHDQPIVGWMFAAYAGKLVWHNTFLIPRALMRRQLRFRELSVIRTLANVGQFIGLIGTAWAGLGIWCFVIGPVCRVLVTGVGVQICHPWRPRFVLRVRESTEWLVFGAKAASSQIVYHVYTNIDYQIIGYMFTPEETGLYWLAYELVLKPCFLIGQALQAIAFAAYSRLKAARAQLIEQFIAFTRLSLVVMLGFLVIIMVLADDILLWIWGADAVPAAAAARILCAVGVLRALSFVIPPLLDGVGRPGLSLMYNALAAVVLPLSFFLCAYAFADRLGYLSIAVGWALGYPVVFSLLVYFTITAVELPLTRYLRRTIGIPLCAMTAVAVGWGARLVLLEQSLMLRMLVPMLTLMATYLLLLAYTQGVSPRSVWRSTRGGSKKPRRRPDDAV